jgi:hypothetical protein
MVLQRWARCVVACNITTCGAIAMADAVLQHAKAIFFFPHFMLHPVPRVFKVEAFAQEKEHVIA